MDPKELRYAPSHEWSRLEGDVCTLGITKFACEQLTDVVYIELPDVGDHVFTGDSFGEIESVKAVSELFSPVTGEVIEANQALADKPELINDSPYGDGWIMKVRLADKSEVDKLLTAEEYGDHIEREAE